MKKLIIQEWKILLFGFLMSFWSSPGQTFFIALFSGEIRSELSLTHGEFGGLYSLATLLSAVVMIWSGALVDKIDLKRFSIASVIGLSVGCGAMSVSAGGISLLISLFLLRHMGQGLMYLISSTTMVRYLEKNKGKASALAGMGYSVSEALMPSVVVALLVWVGWRSGWLVFGFLLLIFVIPMIWFLLNDHHRRHEDYLHSLSHDGPKSGQVYQRRQWTRSEVVSDKLFYLFMPGLMSQPLMFTGFIFHQVHLVEAKNWTLSIWGTLFALYALVAVLSKLVTGFWVDRYGAIRMVPFVALPMALGFVFLASSSHILVAGIFLVLTGMTVGFQTTVSGPFWAELYGSRHLGSIKSLATATVVFTSAISPVALGWFIDRGISVEILALGATIYILLTSSLAFLAYRMSQGRNYCQ